MIQRTRPRTARERILATVSAAVLLSMVFAAAAFASSGSVSDYCFRPWGSSTLYWGGDATMSPAGSGTLYSFLDNRNNPVDSMYQSSSYASSWSNRKATGGVSGGGNWSVSNSFYGYWWSGYSTGCLVY